MTNDERYMRRCFDLARLGAGAVSPNPMVGAVLVHENRIIGEGRHERYGAAHAEVNAVQSVPEEKRHLISLSTLYCCLEPCFHYGQTPPCVDLILEKRIPRVVVSNTDPNPLVAGKSLEKLRAAGVLVTEHVLEAEGALLNRAFFTWITKQRPFIILKWAQSADGFIGRTGQRTAVSGPLIQRLMHRRRREVDAILVGTTTAVVDNPRLDNRLFPGKSPLRIALDFNGKIPPTAHLFDDSRPTWILGPERAGNFQNTRFLPGLPTDWIVRLLAELRADKRAILLVEGGAATLNQFLEAGLWDELHIIRSSLLLEGGISAPALRAGIQCLESAGIGPDRLDVFLPVG